MRLTKWMAAVLCGMALALPVVAQEDVIPKETAPAPSETQPPAEEPAPTPPPPKADPYGIPPLHRWGGWTIAIGAWNPSLVGADEELATTFQNGVGHPQMAGSSARIRENATVIYHLPKNVGSLGGSYDSMDQNDTFTYFTPAQFIWGETRAFPVVLGAFDDGFADGVSAAIIRKTRDFRLWYSQTAFETPRARGTWSVGYRQLSHSRSVDITYVALVPNLPPLIPSATQGNDDQHRLDPLPDRVYQSSNFYGHGLGVSFDLQFPVAPRLCVVTGLSIGLIRGDASSAYSSRSSYYFLAPNVDVPLTKDELFAILEAGVHDEIAKVDQAVVNVGTTQGATSQFAETFDIYLGLEVNVYKGFKIFGTLRDSVYQNVGEYVVPRAGYYNDRISLFAGYEGYVLGLAWRY